MRNYSVTYRAYPTIDATTYTLMTWTGEAQDGEEAIDNALIAAEESHVIHGDIVDVRRA